MGSAARDHTSGRRPGAAAARQERRAPSGDSGVLPYIFVNHVDDTLDQVIAHGGAVAMAPYPEGDLWVATFRDPAGNVVGVWQQGPRS